MIYLYCDNMKAKIKADYENEKIIKEIINHPEFQRRKDFKHHGDISVYEHSLKVSQKAYSLAHLFKVNPLDAAIAGLLHDFYEKPWQEDTEKHKLLKKHGFTHAKNALKNAQKYFKEYLTPEIENAISQHMFPLNKIPPKHKVGWVVNLADKIVSFEVFKHPSKLPGLVGIKIKKKK